MTETGNARGEHGRALMTFLDAELAALGEAPTGWARRNDMTATNLGKWREGEADPTLVMLEEIAAALDRPTVDLLIAAGYITPDQVGGRTVAPLPLPDVADAIERDPILETEIQRNVLRAALALALDHRPGDPPRSKTIKIV